MKIGRLCYTAKNEELQTSVKKHAELLIYMCRVPQENK
jgi:hypothetical protein